MRPVAQRDGKMKKSIAIVTNNEDAIKELNTIYLATELGSVPVVKGDVQEALKMGVDALDKQMPKKPLIIKCNSRTIPYCPICTNLLVKYADEDYREVFGEDWIHMNYCDCCGQRIDWNKVKEEL